MHSCGDDRGDTHPGKGFELQHGFLFSVDDAQDSRPEPGPSHAGSPSSVGRMGDKRRSSDVEYASAVAQFVRIPRVFGSLRGSIPKLRRCALYIGIFFLPSGVQKRPSTSVRRCKRGPALKDQPAKMIAGSRLSPWSSAARSARAGTRSAGGCSRGRRPLRARCAARCGRSSGWAGGSTRAAPRRPRRRGCRRTR